MQQVNHLFGGHIAGRALGIGAAAETGHRGLEVPHTHLQCRQRVGQGLAVGVVKVAANVIHIKMRQRRFKSALHLERRAHADRVGHVHALHADLFHQPGQVAHALGRHLALVRAAHGAAHGAAHRNACRQRGLHHRGKARHAFGNRAVDVLVAESLAGRAKHHDLIGLGFQRGFKALQIRREHRVAHTGLALNARHHLRVIRHLRHPFGRYKAGDFNFGHARGLQTVHQLDLDGSRHRLLFVLQAVTRADVDQLDKGRQVHK